MAAEDKNIEKSGARTPVEAERVDQPPTFIPAADIVETDHEAVLLLDLPACDEKALDIRLEEGTLTVTGHVAADDFPGHQLTYSEYRVGDFERAFSVSEMVDTAKIEAAIKDGVLRLTLPKVEAAKPKKIEIKAT